VSGPRCAVLPEGNQPTLVEAVEAGGGTAVPTDAWPADRIARRRRAMSLKDAAYQRIKDDILQQRVLPNEPTGRGRPAITPMDPLTGHPRLHGSIYRGV
jgi:hypothetical protein